MGWNRADSPRPAPFSRCCGGRLHLRGNEDIGHNVGHVVLLAGEPIDGNIPEGGSREAYEMAFQIHGAEAADFNMVFDEKKDTYVYQEPEKRTPPQTKGDKPKEPER